jgi:hypothetical protein
MPEAMMTIAMGDLWYIGGAFLVLIIGCALGAKYYFNIRNNAPEAALFLAARKYLHPPPIMRIADTDGNGFLALGKVDQKGDVTFQFSEAGGVQVNPRLSGVAPEDKINGIPFYNYSTSFPFPLGARNAQAFKAIIEFTRKKYPQVKFITDLRLLELIALPADQLLHDCTNVIESMEQSETQDTIGNSLIGKLTNTLGLSDVEVAEIKDFVPEKLTSPQLVTIIREIQAESHVIPVNKGYYSYDWAFARIPSSILAQDIHQMKLLIKRQLSFDQIGQYEKYIPLALAFAMIVGVVVLASMMIPK